MRAHVIPEFIEHCVNIDFGIEHKSEDPPNFNPYDMLPTFKENQKLQAIGAKIDAIDTLNSSSCCVLTFMIWIILTIFLVMSSMW
jgi:hypothetical protein